MVYPLCSSASSAVQSLLSGRIRQIVEIDVLSIPIDPGCDHAKAIELGAGGLLPFSQIEAYRAIAQGNNDTPLACRFRWRISQTPMLRNAIGIDVRGAFGNMPAGAALGPVDGREEEPLAAWAIDGNAQEACRQA